MAVVDVQAPAPHGRVALDDRMARHLLWIAGHADLRDVDKNLRKRIE